MPTAAKSARAVGMTIADNSIDIALDFGLAALPYGLITGKDDGFSCP